MTAARPMYNRSDIRSGAFAQDFTCDLLAYGDESRTLCIRPVDVSRRGLGFLASEPLSPGEFFLLKLGPHQFRVEVAFCHSYLGIADLFRCGLFIREEQGDLATLCRQLGVLEGEPAEKVVAP